MHLSSYDNMKHFREKYLSAKESQELHIVDLGSTDIFGCYRDIFDSPQWRYTGMDLMPGKNVDLVLSDPYNWLEIDSASVDVFISGQTFEHIEFFWQTMLEISRILKPGGLCCIIAPSGGPEHRYPVDCWRFFSDGFNALSRYAKLKTIEIKRGGIKPAYEDDSELWSDTVLVAEKPNLIKNDSSHEHIYSRSVDIKETEDSLNKIKKYLSPDKTVLELGPAEGYFTEYLQKQMNCVVDCVEISPEMAEKAEKFCRKMIVANLDEIDLSAHFEEDAYDFIIIADVLEHLIHGKDVLTACKRLMKKDGTLLLSVPNISHSVIIGSLLKGQFEYRDEGLLDKTHVKFYTRDSLLKVLHETGYTVEVFDTVIKLPEDTLISDSLGELPFEIQKQIFSGRDALTYQFIVSACVADPEEKKAPLNLDREPPRAVDLRKAFLMSLYERNLENEHLLANANNHIIKLEAVVENFQMTLNQVENDRIQIERLEEVIQNYQPLVQENENNRNHIAELEKIIANYKAMVATKDKELFFTLLKAEETSKNIQDYKSFIEKMQGDIEKIQHDLGYRINRRIKKMFGKEKGEE